MNLYSEFHITQIVTALPGWVAVYKHDDDEGSPESTRAVVCWAIFHPNPAHKKPGGVVGDMVVGMVPGEHGFLEPTAEHDNFVAYRRVES